MHLSDFRIEDNAVVAAITEAELRTSGEIRVVVAEEKVSEPLPAAQREFERLGMTKTAARNGVLIFIAPRSHTFAVVGDSGIHEKCGPTFWDELAHSMSDHFKRGDFTPGVVAAIQRAGTLLATHFPRRPDDRNELPNQIERT